MFAANIICYADVSMPILPLCVLWRDRPRRPSARFSSEDFSLVNISIHFGAFIYANGDEKFDWYACVNRKARNSVVVRPHKISGRFRLFKIETFKFRRRQWGNLELVTRDKQQLTKQPNLGREKASFRFRRQTTQYCIRVRLRRSTIIISQSCIVIESKFHHVFKYVFYFEFCLAYQAFLYCILFY